MHDECIMFHNRCMQSNVSEHMAWTAILFPRKRLNSFEGGYPSRRICFNKRIPTVLCYQSVLFGFSDQLFSLFLFFEPLCFALESTESKQCNNFFFFATHLIISQAHYRRTRGICKLK